MNYEEKEKRVKVEYVKVKYSKAWLAAKDHEERIKFLYRQSDLNDAIKGNNWKAIQSAGEAAQYYFDLYKKVATEITERDEHEELESVKAADWNGEGLPPVGVVYAVDDHKLKLLCKYSSDYVVVGEMLPRVDYKGMEVVINIKEQPDRVFYKPETPEQKLEREELEAAEKLYHVYMKPLGVDYADWEDVGDKNQQSFLGIVRETKYRKESD